MKTSLLKCLTVVALAASLAGCYTPSGRPDYTANGALIGGAAGLLAGGLVGHSMDQEAEARRYVPPPPPPVAYVAPPPAVPPPGVADIKNMARSGVSDDVIINQIINSHAVYTLDANAIIDLSTAGVSQRVITAMIGTGNPTVTQAPPPPQVEPVIVSPGPEYVWVGGEWVWDGGRWVWVGGRWSLPPRHHAVWVEARWVHGSHGYYRVGGAWRY